MTCKELLEKEKEKILSELEQAAVPEKVQKTVSDIWERLLYRYQESEEDKKLAEAAVTMIRVAQSDAGLADTVGETKVWQTSGAAGRASSGRRIGTKTIVMLVLGVICGAAAIALAAVSPQAADSAAKAGGWLSLMPVILETLAAVLLVLAGRTVGKPAAQAAGEQRVEVRSDAEKIWRSLMRTALLIDQNLEQKAKDLQWEKRKQQETTGIQGLDPEGVELMADLLEAAGSGDGAYALEKAEDVRYFLHRQGVELVEYSEDRAQLFDKLPSDRTGTIRPALVRDGKLLKKGLAGGGL